MDKKHLGSMVRTGKQSLSSIIESCTTDYIGGLDMDNIPPVPVMVNELLEDVAYKCSLENATRAKEDRLKSPKSLNPYQIGELVLAIYNIVYVKTDGILSKRDGGILAIYQEDGVNAGLYVEDKAFIENIIYSFNVDASTANIKQTYCYILNNAPMVAETRDQNIIAVNNGIYLFDKKKLIDFSPEYVFLSKIKYDYHDNVMSPIFTNEDGSIWDFDSWMDSLSPDKDVVRTLWELISAVLRPNVPFKKLVLLYNAEGNSGKGTLFSILENLLGDAYLNASLDELGQKFKLENLPFVNVILSHETRVGAYIDDLANVKALVTHDTISIDRKYKTSISYRFRGIYTAAINELPSVSDKSDSWYRRLLIIPMTNCFTGRENKDIKEVYLKDRETLEYILYKALNMDFYEFSIPKASEELMKKYKLYNDVTRTFLDEMLPKLTWQTFIPNQFLFDLYKSWYEKNVPNGKALGRNKFYDQVNNIISDFGWKVQETPYDTLPACAAPEPLICENNLVDWKNPTYTGGDTNKICTPSFENRSKMRGYVKA